MPIATVPTSDGRFYVSSRTAATSLPDLAPLKVCI